MKKEWAWILLAASAGSAQAVDFVDTAKVVSSVPVTERVPAPRQECWMETVTSTGPAPQAAPVQDHSIGGALVGALVGGVVGNQVGQGRGNTAATATGAVAGALIGDRVANQNQAAQPAPVPQTQTRQEQHCRTIDGWRDVVRGYDVTYHYNGKTIKVRLPSDPGKTVQVGVSAFVPDAGNPPAPPPGNPPPPPLR